MAHLDALIVEVERGNTVKQSVLTLIQRFADDLEHAKNDPVAIQALADSLRSQNDALADAVSAHTVAEDEEEEPTP